jgi:hypothetical protein
MTIGPAVPGTPTTVTPDVGHAAYTSAQGPAPDGEVTADDVLMAIQIALNVQAYATAKILAGTPAQMVALTNVSAGWIFEVDSLANLGRFVAYGSDPGYGAPWVYASTGTSGIYWINTQISLLLSTNTGSGTITRGICRVGPMTGFDAGTPDGKIPAAVVQNRVYWNSALASSTFLYVALSSGGTQTVVLLGSSYIAEVGDRITGSVGPMIVRSWATDYAEFSVVLLQDVNGENGGPTSIIMHRCRAIPIVPYVLFAATLPFNAQVAVPGTARIQLDFGAGNDTFAVEGTDATDYKLGSVTIYRP